MNVQKATLNQVSQASQAFTGMNQNRLPVMFAAAKGDSFSRTVGTADQVETDIKARKSSCGCCDQEE